MVETGNVPDGVDVEAICPLCDTQINSKRPQPVMAIRHKLATSPDGRLREAEDFCGFARTAVLWREAVNLPIAGVVVKSD
jgi:hypothetical protein